MSRKNLDALLEFLIEFAQLMLQDHREFYPFGAGMSLTGEMTSVGVDTGRERPPSREVIELLFSGLSEQANKGEIVAAGICMDVKIVPPGSIAKTDAVCAELEHQDGEAVDVFLPYVIGSSGSITYGELFATPGE